MIQQSGDVTRGHGVEWVADGVVRDAGSNPYSQRVLTTLLNANFNDTGDQPIALPGGLVCFQLTGIIVARPTGSLTLAAGGFYTEASKGGTPIVAATQIYTALTANTKLMQPTLTAYVASQAFTRAQLPDWAVYFSLTTPQGIDYAADIYLLGVELG